MIKKIAYLFSPGPFGGAEQVVLKGVAALGIENLWLIKESRNPKPCEEFENRCQENNIKYTIVDCDSQFDTKTIKQLKSLIKQFDIQIIHSHGMKANFYNALMPVKKVATQHGKTSHTFKTRILEKIEALALKRMDLLICVSKQMYANEKHSKKVLIENFLSNPFPLKRYQSNDRLKLVYIGRLSYEKGLIDLWQALSELNDIELIMVGTGQLENELKAKALKSDIQVKFVGFQKDISPYIAEGSALILPSHREGLPMIIIEAAAAGLPILASDVGGIADVIGNSGILFSPNKPEEIKQSIERFSLSRDFYNQKAEALALQVQKRYSIKTWIEKINETYLSLE